MNFNEFKALHLKFMRNHPEPATSWFSKILPERERTKWFLSALRTLKDKEVLDLCGGYGEFGAYLQAKKFSFNYTCLDINSHRIKCGPEYFRTFGLKEPAFLLHDVKKPLPLPKDMFDVVWLFGWCDSYFDCDQLFREVHRVLKNGGIFLFNMAKSTATHYQTRYSRKNLLTLLERTDFSLVRLDSIDAQDFGVVAHAQN